LAPPPAAGQTLLVARLPLPSGEEPGAITPGASFPQAGGRLLSDEGAPLTRRPDLLRLQPGTGCCPLS
ncbi:hypothetical protein, partial [Thermogemmatispora sp.]|uniref:hypothetical protein n=1 Tax=Thermogemmatispora sp. TaxID=1968838 RepID=UPI002618D6CF